MVAVEVAVVVVAVVAAVVVTAVVEKTVVAIASAQAFVVTMFFVAADTSNETTGLVLGNVSTSVAVANDNEDCDGGRIQRIYSSTSCLISCPTT